MEESSRCIGQHAPKTLSVNRRSHFDGLNSHISQVLSHHIVLSRIRASKQAPIGTLRARVTRKPHKSRVSLKAPHIRPIPGNLIRRPLQILPRGQLVTDPVSLIVQILASVAEATLAVDPFLADLLDLDAV